MDRNKNVVKIGHNSNRSLSTEIGEDISHELQQLKKAYRGLKDMMCNNISYMLDYQSTDLEDLRVSTRVADRFKYLQCATDKNESIKATIDALRPLAYSHEPNHKISEYQIHVFRDRFGGDIADYEINYAISDDKNSQDHKEEK